MNFGSKEIRNKGEIEEGSSWKDIIKQYSYDGEKADVFSFGMTLWCFFNERNPIITIDSKGKIERKEKLSADIWQQRNGDLVCLCNKWKQGY